MRRAVWATLGLLALSGCMIEPQQTMEIAVRKPETGLRLERIPTPGEILRVYPPKALAQGVIGDVTLLCVLDASGYFTHCAVETETPPEWGFGEAGLKVAGKYQATRLRPDVALDGHRVRLPVHFRLG
ncbi:MAG: TonB family protein [Proteobacteria bacterium]|nr:TonB family protein [Pseudomonadota bacterium]